MPSTERSSLANRSSKEVKPTMVRSVTALLHVRELCELSQRRERAHLFCKFD